MRIPTIVLMDAAGRYFWEGTMTQFARDNGHDVARDVIAQFRESVDHGRVEPALIGGGAAPHFSVLLTDYMPSGDDVDGTLDHEDFLRARPWLLAEDEPDDRCTNPGGHVWNRTAGEADEARLAGDYENDNIRCIYCGADGDA